MDSLIALYKLIARTPAVNPRTQGSAMMLATLFETRKRTEEVEVIAPIDDSKWGKA